MSGTAQRTTQTSIASTGESEEHYNNLDLGTIIAIIFGGLALLAILAGLCCLALCGTSCNKVAPKDEKR